MNDKELTLLILGVVLMIVGMLMLVFVIVNMANTRSTLVDGVPSKYTTAQWVFLGISIFMLVLSLILLIMFFISLYRDPIKERAIEFKKSASEYIEKKQKQKELRDLARNVESRQKSGKPLSTRELPSQQVTIPASRLKPDAVPIKRTQVELPRTQVQPTFGQSRGNPTLRTVYRPLRSDDSE